jgi:hypothetical protein
MLNQTLIQTLHDKIERRKLPPGDSRAELSYKYPIHSMLKKIAAQAPLNKYKTNKQNIL